MPLVIRWWAAPAGQETPRGHLAEPGADGPPARLD